MTSRQNEVGEGLEICHVFKDFFLKKYRSIVHFCGWTMIGGRLTKLLIFCGRHNCMALRLRTINISISCDLTNSIIAVHIKEMVFGLVLQRTHPRNEFPASEI